MSFGLRVGVMSAMLGFATPGFAAWQAGLSDEDEGQIFVASVTDTGGALRLLCHGKTFNLRFEPADTGKGDEPLNQSFKLVLKVDGEQAANLTLAYEAMDGALATSIAKTAPFLARLKAGARLEISDPGGRYPTARFTLAKAGASIGKLEKACR